MLNENYILTLFPHSLQVFINFARQQTDEVEFKDSRPHNRSRALRKLRLRLGLLTSGRLGPNRDDTVRFTSLPEMDETNDDNYEVTFSNNVS